MKRFITLLILTSLGSWSFGQEIDMERIEFVNKFYIAVIAHEQSKVIKLMDKDYRKEQIKFLDGNKEQFVNELFGGVDINSKEYVNLKLTDIDNIEIQDAFDRGKDEWEYVFHIKSGDLTVERSLMLLKSGKKYGFIGSQG